MKNDYSDIINHPHYVSKTRPQMSEIERAAQFSPFAALTGYDAAIKETGRLRDERIDFGEETKKRCWTRNRSTSTTSVQPNRRSPSYTLCSNT